MSDKDWYKVNEAEYECKPSSYNVFLTNSELKELPDYLEKRPVVEAKA